MNLSRRILFLLAAAFMVATMAVVMASPALAVSDNLNGNNGNHIGDFSNPDNGNHNGGGIGGGPTFRTLFQASR